jgi:hypothetical protein
MGKLPLALLALLATALPAAAGGPVRKLGERYPVSGIGHVALEFPVGEVVVTARDGRELIVDVALECDRPKSRSCLDAAREVRLVGRASGRRLRVELDDWPRAGGRGLQANARVQMPRALPLSLDLGVGDLSITGMEGDLEVDLGVGEVTVTMAESAVALVDLDVGVGEADLSTPHGRHAGKGWIAKELHWRKGPGNAEVRIDCGVGEIRVALH